MQLIMKKAFKLTFKDTWSMNDSMNRPKTEFIAYIYKHLKYKNYL